VRAARNATVALIATVAALPAAVADVAAGRQKAQQVCAVCHGPLGVAVAPETPNLAGEPAGYLARQLKAFRSGQRRHEVMAVIAKQLSDAEIDDVASWFASIRIEATAP
jgi:cytochrome c553